MTMGNPEYLILLLLPLPVVFIALGNYRKGRGSLALLSGRADGEDVFGWYMVKIFFGVASFCIFLILSVIALADLSWGKAPVEEDRSGLDVMFVMDVSRSMLAQDIAPNRLKAAADIAQGVMQGLPDARFGVTAFKGGAVTLVPMTEDQQVLESLLNNLNTGLVNAPGTSLESGIEEALRSFPAGTERRRVIILLSDGESLETYTGRSAVRAGEEGIPVFAIGAGSAEGSTIRLSDGTLVTGRNRRPVVTRLNEEALRSAAESSGGVYFTAREPGIVSRLLEEILSFEEARGRMGFRLVSVRRYRGFLLAGFIFLLLSLLIRSIRWKHGV